MSNLGSLTVTLALDTAKFVDGVRKSRQETQQMVENITASVGRIATVFGAVVASAGAMAFALDKAAGSISIYKDLGDQMGDTAEAVSGLQLAADLSGTAMDNVAAASVRLTAELSKTSDQSKGAGAALKALNIPLEEFKQLSPVEQMERVAVQLAKFEDGAGKTAAAVALFGKSGAQLVPFLNDLADVGARNARMTQEQIEAADAFTKSQARMRAEVQAVGRSLLAETLPAVNTLASELAKAANQVLGLSTVGAEAKRNNTVREFAQDAAVGLAVVVESAIAAAKAVRTIAGSFEVVGSDISVEFNRAIAGFKSFLPQDQFSKAQADLKDAMERREKTLQEANQRYVDLWNYNGTAISDAVRRAFSEEQRIIDRMQADPRELARRGRPVQKDQIDTSNFLQDDSAKRAAEEAQRYLDNLRRQLEGTKELTTAEQVLLDIRQGRAGAVNASMERELVGIAKQIDAAKALESQLKAEQEQMRAWQDERKRLAEEGRQLYESLRTPQEQAAAQQERLNVLLNEGAIVWDTYARAVQASVDQQIKARQQVLDGLYSGLLTEEEVIKQSYERKREAILASTEITELERQDLLRRLEKQFADEQQQRQQAINQAQLGAAATMFDGLAGLAKAYGGEQSRAYRTLFAISKAFSVAQAAMSIATGLAKAQELGFPANLAEMARVAATGAGIVASIRGSNFSGAYDKGGDIPAGHWGIAGEFGPEIIEGPARVTSRIESAKLLQGGGQPQNIRIINAFDMQVVDDYLGSDAGERLIMNAVRRNADTVTQLVNGGG